MAETREKVNKISIKNLTAGYKRGQKVISVPTLDILLEEGNVYGVFGSNHVGKSTFLKVLAQVRKGLFTSNETEILFDDKNYDRKVRKPRISFVPQKYRETILGWYSIRKNLEIPLLASNKSEEFIENRINQICNELGYESRESFFSNFGFFENENTLKSKMPSQLSGGQQQILVLLRSLVVNPSVLVLDEPFSALDIYKGNQFRKNLLTYLVENEILTIFISHDLEEIVDMADKIIFMQPVQDNSSIAGIENVNINRNGANLDKDESKNFMKKMKEKYLEPNG